MRTQHGVGTFVVERPGVLAGLERLDSITETIRATGREPGMIYQRRTVRPPSPDKVAKMGVAAEDLLLELRRSVLADHQIVRTPMTYYRSRYSRRTSAPTT